ncbi:hypothetical protein V1477_001532, partial [Vespula maculifrons]
MVRQKFQEGQGALDYFFRNQLIWNILYEIFDNWRYNGIIVLHSPIGTSSASKISPQFYDYLFTPSNITASYEAYLRRIADKSLSLSLSGSQKLSDR